MEPARNKKWIVRLGLFWVCVATAHASVELGIDMLASHDYSLLADKRVGLTIAPDARMNLAGLGVCMLSEMNREARPNLFRRSSASKLDIFYKVCGGTFIRTSVSEGESPQRIIADWRPNEQEFRRRRAQYLLY